MATVLRTLLVDRHSVTYGQFLREYDRVAFTVEPNQVGQGPTKSQYSRWIRGDLRTAPRENHWRVLEAMFPGWTVEQLFATPDAPVRPQLPHRTGDIAAVFADRAQFLAGHSPESVFAGAHTIAVVGVSMNMLCQQFSELRLRNLIEAGTIVRAMFLDPDGRHIDLREDEEGLANGSLRALTKMNIATLQHVQQLLTPSASERLQVRIYDEPPRFNITVIDGMRCIAQLYLPRARAGDSPTLVLERSIPHTGGLFQVFTNLFEAMWDRAAVYPTPEIRGSGCYERRVVPFRRIAQGTYPPVVVESVASA